MTTTTQLRDWWSPACRVSLAKVALHGEGLVSVRESIVDAVHALNACLEAHNYETRKADTGAYNCRPITGGDRYSLHAYGIAVDLNWQTNPYGPRLKTDMPPAMVADIKTIRTRNGKQVWRWGGNYGGNKDAMHYEITCHPADLETGLDPATIPTPKADNPKADDMTPEQSKKLDAVELRSIATLQRLEELAKDVPPNLAAELDELRRNVRAIATAVGVPASDIET